MGGQTNPDARNTTTAMAFPRRAKLTDRWPTALAVVSIAGAIAVIILLDREVELFGSSIAVMAGIYLMAYALGRPWTAWLAFVVLSAVVTALQFLHAYAVLKVDPPTGMSIVLVVLWLWAVTRGRFRDGWTFSVQTAGMMAFGVLTLVCAAVQPRFGVLLAGVGFLAHAVWDAYHFKVNRVVNRPWSEYCGVVDVAVGVALIIAAVV